jgi:hypothetical protein
VFINKDSLIVNGINLGRYIVQATYSYNKLWSSDSGRNLAGEQSGTLVGIFPKIVVQFRKLTQTELEDLAPVLDSARQTVQYYDANKKAMTTMTTYTGDYEIVNKGIIGHVKNEGFQISFIATKRRS